MFSWAFHMFTYGRAGGWRPMKCLDSLQWVRNTEAPRTPHNIRSLLGFREETAIDASIILFPLYTHVVHIHVPVITCYD